MTLNHTINADGSAKVGGTNLKVRVGLDRQTGNRYFYIPEIRSKGQEYQNLGACPNSLWVNHDALIERMVELGQADQPIVKDPWNPVA